MAHKETQSPEKTDLHIDTHQNESSNPSVSLQSEDHIHDYRDELMSPTHELDIEEIGQRLGSPKKHSVPPSINESMSPLMHEMKPKIPTYAQRSTLLTVSNGFAEKAGDYRVDSDYVIDFDTPTKPAEPQLDLLRHSRRRFSDDDISSNRGRIPKEHPLRQALRAKSPAVSHRREYGHTPLDYRSTILNSQAVSPTTGLVSPRHKPLFSVKRTDEQAKEHRASLRKQYLSPTASQLGKIKLSTAPIGAVKSVGVWK